MKRIKDPADGCMVVYDPSKGKYMVGDFEIEDSDDEMEATQTRIEVKEEDEDANLLDLIDD
ncbi:uncharacterized protein MELLADRAFT_72062 [Melampsora larici-populina 98AG31]|uniref:Uncharacterized protein n=1 Tax=Melampsora larici-populina (strain 98AG31 / pathotype 3-4-7) TaxID=747676 RepID=F4RPB1_MELLP|nr:uncharacterized protein MELLADRAFT_72062 [Melampsora larici-populina 98AG31]EGG05879.1 hypothetical protein MELLADRAFT_72062 [Melampsora larici-populina 98AG31]